MTGLAFPSLSLVMEWVFSELFLQLKTLVALKKNPPPFFFFHSTATEYPHGLSGEGRPEDL